MITLIQAIARQEGFYKNGTRAAKNNNPGSLNHGWFSKSRGAVGRDDKGYAVFPSPEVGFAALEALLKTSRYRGQTIELALMAHCHPGSDPLGYSEYLCNICSWTGLTPATIIDEYVSNAVHPRMMTNVPG